MDELLKAGGKVPTYPTSCGLASFKYLTRGRYLHIMVFACVVGTAGYGACRPSQL